MHDVHIIKFNANQSNWVGTNMIAKKWAILSIGQMLALPS